MAVYNISDYDIEAQFMVFLRNNNIEPADNIRLILDGQCHRYRLNGDKHGDKSGAYCIYTDGFPAGWAEDWHVGQSINWHYDTSGMPKEQRDYYESPEYKKKIEVAKKKREQERLQRQAEASDKARIRIETLPDAPENHRYLQAKQIYPYSVKLDGQNLAIPLHDINGNIKSLQWISPDGEKKIYPDTMPKGLFWSIGLDLLTTHPNWPILLGEGYATMAKVHELTGYPCIAGISCYYLAETAKALKGKYAKHKIIVMADNDKKTELKRGFNPGIDHAKTLVKAGLAHDMVVPDFNNPEDGSDWDDFALLHGDTKTANILERKISFAITPLELKNVLGKTTRINAQDLRNKVFPPVKWAVPGFLPEGLSILAGGPKVGKSILALHLSVGVAIGGCVLGKIFVQQGDVLYLALEDTQRRLQDRINGGELASDDTIDLSHLEIVTEIPRQNLGGTLYIEYWLSTHKNARLVIIDTLQMFRKLLTGKGSMYSEDYEAISTIKKIADVYGVPILIIHHLKKGMEGDWLSEISGSQGIAGAADTIFSLKRERNSTLATLHRTGRDVEEKDFIMKLDGFGWILQDEAEAFTLPEWKRQILDYLRNNPSVTPMQLADTANISHDAAKKNLQRLLKEGLIKKTGYGVYELSN